MTIPPSLIRFRLGNAQHRFSLWLPLFVIWPFAAVFALVLLPFVLLTAAVFWRKGYGKTLLMSGPRLMSCLCALRGLDIHVGQKQNGLIISVL
jgi:hypothetical protein